MSIETFEKREEIIKLREKVLQAEQKMIRWRKMFSVKEVRKRLEERLDEI